MARIAHAIGAGFSRYLSARFVLEHPLLRGVALPERLGTRGNSGPR